MAIGNRELWWKCVRRSFSLSFASLCCLVGVHKTATAQVTPDNSWGSQSTEVIRNGTINNEVIDYIIRGGIRQGNAVFHLFSEFNVLTGEKAYFDPDLGIDRVWASVTGGLPSFIDGVVGVTTPADLSLFNPEGFYLGRNASFDLPESSLFLGTGEGFYAEQSLQGNFLKVTLAPRTIAPDSAIISKAHLSVGGDLNLEAALLDFRGSLQAGGSINLMGFDVFLQDDTDEPTTLQAGQGLTIRGDRIKISLHRHPDSGIFVNGFVSFVGSESVLIKGPIVVEGNNSPNAMPPWIAVESEERIRLRKAILRVFGDGGSIDFNTPVLEIFSSEVGAEFVEAHADIFRIEDSQVFSRGENSPTLGEIDIQATEAGSFDRVSLILETLKGSIQITSNFIIFLDSEILNRSLQSHENPKINLKALDLSAKNSRFETTTANEGNIGDIKFEVRDLVLEETNIFAPGNINIVTQTFDSSESLIESESGGVNVEILPTPIFPPVPKTPVLPPATFSPPVLDNVDIGKPGTLLDFDFNETESQLGNRESSDIAMDNRCAAPRDNGLFAVQQRPPLPSPTAIIFSPLRSQGLGTDPILTTPSNNPQKAVESFPLQGGGIFLGHRCPAIASHSWRFFS